MRHNEQVRVLKGLMTHLDNGTNVDAGKQMINPVDTYLSPDRAEQEWQVFFQRHTQLLGLSADLPGPNTFFTSDELGKPLLCTRDQKGKFHAFINACRHRGTVVETEARGTRATFSCPFHAWTYSAQGDLVSVPREGQFGQVDKACYSLIQVPAIEQDGVLWVHPDPEGVIDLDEQLGDLAVELADWNLADMQFDGDVQYDHPMNWKLAIDTFGETYHFNVLHKNTLAESFYGNVQMYDTFKRNHRMSLCQKSIDTLRDLPEQDWDVLVGTLPVYYLFPNIQLIVSPAGPTLVRVYPRGTNTADSYSKISFYLSPKVREMMAQPGFEHLRADVGDRMKGFGEVIRDEDYVAAASSHRGMAAGHVDHVIFGRNEPALHHYHNTYRVALGMAPLEVK
jgi:nitrite reductase/ring-hydroxylating ferredoxin subunit